MSTAARADSVAAISLRESWELRNLAAETLIKSELQLRRLLESASAEQLVQLLESFSPARSPGPEWTRSFEALAERLWAWCDPALLGELEREFRARGAGWVPVANAFTADQGERIRAQLRQGSPAARMPRFTLG